MVFSGLKIIFQGVNFDRLLFGLWEGIWISFVSVLFGIILGVLLGISYLHSPKFMKVIFRGYLELFRIVPILAWLYFFYYFLPSNYEITIASSHVAIFVFSLWIGAEMSDLVRGALQSLPQHQIESGLALGLSWPQLYKQILVPQAMKRLLPSTLNLVTRVIKTSSLLMMIGVIEVISVGKQIIEVNNGEEPSIAFWVYGLIFLMYFLVCFPLSKVSQMLEKKWQTE